MTPARFKQKYGPWALVTGCAMGIGASFVEQVAARGFNLVLVDIDAGAIGGQAERLKSRVEVREVVVDLADPKLVSDALDSIADLEIGLLVANAAYAATAPWLEIPLEDKLRQI